MTPQPSDPGAESEKVILPAAEERAHTAIFPDDWSDEREPKVEENDETTDNQAN